MSILEKFIQFSEEQQLINKGDLLVLAVSGGVDSVVLVDLCVKAGFQFVIAHVNFSLRAGESERDELFVRELASNTGVPFHIKKVDTAGYASANSVSIQEAARTLRYDWFEELRNELAGGWPRGRILVVTAHHLDDSVETMLMNMFRGTGITGLRGILPKTGHLVRPMLCITKPDIRSFAEHNQLKWVEDSSNQLDKYTRNYFRNQLIPMIRKVFPQVDQNLYHNLDRFQDSVVFYRESVDRHIKKLLEPHGDEVHLPIRKLTRLPAYKTILFEVMQEYGFYSGQLPELIKLLRSVTGSQLVSTSHRVIRNREWLIIAPLRQADANFHVIEQADKLLGFEKGELTIQHLRASSIPYKADKSGVPAEISNSIAFLNASQVQYPMLLRRARPGDYFYPLGMKKKKKVARFLIDIKLSKTAKESVWVLESGKRIAWVVGYRIDDRFKLQPNTTEVIRIELT